MKTLDALVAGLISGFLIGSIIGGLMVVDSNRSWRNAAFERGYMEKKIDENDNVIYVWIKIEDK
jgi:hypothetical protein